MKGDVIYRQDAIDALQKEINKGIPPFDDVMRSIRCGVRLARNIIEDLPTARARWEYVDYGGVGNWHCSACRAINQKRTNFCPNCGRDMRGDYQ